MGLARWPAPLFMATAKTKTNLLIGARILIDWPNRWAHAAPDQRDRLRAEAEKSKNEIGGCYWFGEKATIIAFHPDGEKGKEYDVLLDSSHEIESLHQSWFTVMEVPKPDGEVVTLLTKILAAIEALDRNNVKAIKDAEPAL